MLTAMVWECQWWAIFQICSQACRITWHWTDQFTLYS